MRKRTERFRGGALVRASARLSLPIALGVLALVGLVAPGGARPDRRDLYTLLGYEAGVSHHQVLVAGDAVCGRARAYRVLRGGAVPGGHDLVKPHG